jgi:hypothetical protein
MFGKGLDKGPCAAWRAPAAEELVVPSTLPVHPTVLDSIEEACAGPLTFHADGLTPAGHWSSASLPSRLNREWALLCDSAAGRHAVREWAVPGGDRAALSGLVDVDGLHATVQLLQSRRGQRRWP